jgi:hypothetical protein
MVPRTLRLLPLISAALLSVSASAFGADWLPASREVFRPLWADPKELGYQLRWSARDSRQPVTEIGLGDYLGIVRTEPEAPLEAQLSIGAGVISRFDTYNHSRDFEVADFSLVLPLDLRSGPNSVRLALWHTSSHLGDDFIRLNPSIATTPGGLHKAYTDEFQAIYSYDVSHALRLYGGAADAVNIIPPDARGRVQGGFEASWPVFREHAEVRLGTDLQWYARRDGRFATDVRLGLRAINSRRLGGVMPFIGYYNGPIYYQQVFPQVEKQFTMGVRIDMGSPVTPGSYK